MTSSLAHFLASVDKKAFHMAKMATLNTDDALDIVQDAMEKMVRHYSKKSSTDWPPLFYRILNNCIMDWHRKKKFRNLFFFWQQHDEESEDNSVVIDIANEQLTPEALLAKNSNNEQMIAFISALPTKQQQCFLLRCWQGFSVAKTAQIMQCSQGTIKTHYSRAVAKLNEKMENLNA